MTMVGADVTELREFARYLDGAATALDQTRTTLQARLGSARWDGPDHTRFMGEWSRAAGPSLRNLSVRFRSAAGDLRRNATEQEQASSSDGGLAASGDSCGWERGDTLPGDLEISPIESRGCWEAGQGNPEQAGRDVIARALRDTHDGKKVAPDEFEIIELDNGKYIVVLPGVTDLSAWGPWAKENIGNAATGRPLTDSPLGLDPGHRSVRDLDYGAISSAGGTSTADNPYAQYVQEKLREAGVPYGADISIVGHSYGADTAVDLAANPNFNGGPNGYNVTHVLAAGYNSRHDILDVPSSTNVLAIQNNRDAAVIVEGLGDSPRSIGQGGSDVIGGILGGNAGQVAAGGYQIGKGAGEIVGDAFGVGKDFLGDMASGARLSDPFAGKDEAWENAWTLEPGTTHTPNGQVNIVFEGGDVGFGHDPVNYADYMSNSDSADVAAFSQSMADSGYAGSGEAWVADVSVPESGG